MINWSELVTGLTVNSFVTINSKSYAYKNNVTLNPGPAINVIGNPASFFSGTANYNSNINDGRTRNATRMFIYQALNAESDYTSAQAIAYGNTSSTDEFLIVRGTRSPALTGALTWPVHSSITGGSRSAATATSIYTLELVAIRDRNGHVRAWRMKSGLTAAQSASFAGAYDKLTDAQIRTEFGLSGGQPATPDAATGTFTNQTQNVSATSSQVLSRRFTPASGGTGTITYQLRRPHAAGITLTGTTLSIPASVSGTQAITIRATWTSGTSTAFLDRVITLNITRSQAPVAGTFSPSAKSVTTTPTGTGSVTVDAATGGTGAITYQLRRPHATGLSLSGRTLSFAANTPAGTHSITIRAIWTTVEGTRFVQASFNLVLTRQAVTPPPTPTQQDVPRGGGGISGYWVQALLRNRRWAEEEEKKVDQRPKLVFPRR